MAVAFATDLDKIQAICYMQCLPQEYHFIKTEMITHGSQYCKSGRRNTVEKFHQIKTFRFHGNLHEYF